MLQLQDGIAARLPPPVPGRAPRAREGEHGAEAPEQGQAGMGTRLGMATALPQTAVGARWARPTQGSGQEPCPGRRVSAPAAAQGSGVI